MPPVDAAYLLDYLFEIGPTMSGVMGSGPITFQELQAWQEQIGVELSPWEVRTLRYLSSEYLTASHEAEKRDCPAPWIPKEMTEANREAIARQVETSLRAKAKT